jgi:hypothetical protein
MIPVVAVKIAKRTIPRSTEWSAENVMIAAITAAGTARAMTKGQ